MTAAIIPFRRRRPPDDPGVRVAQWIALTVERLRADLEREIGPFDLYQRTAIEACLHDVCDEIWPDDKAPDDGDDPDAA